MHISILLIWRVNHSIWQEIIEKVSDITPCHFGVSFTTAGAERLPLTQVGWQDWVSNCDVDVSTVDLSQIDTECLGKLLDYRFVLLALNEHLVCWNKVLSLVTFVLNAQAQSWHTFGHCKFGSRCSTQVFP